MEITKAPYYNYPQMVIKLSSKPHKMFIGGRGVGKTTIISDEMIRYMSHMNRGKISLNGLTYFHIRTKSLPPIIDHLERQDSKSDPAPGQRCLRVTAGGSFVLMLSSGVCFKVRNEIFYAKG